jgi:hypothetical protein
MARRVDKEQALAEETRATLAALDAMRKAHESEVRREVDKFKAEFLARGSHAADLSHLSTRHQYVLLPPPVAHTHRPVRLFRSGRNII